MKCHHSIKENSEGTTRQFRSALHVILQKRLRVFHRGFQTRENPDETRSTLRFFEIAFQSCIISQDFGSVSGIVVFQ